MSVVILGGNECMVRQYKDLCREYQCRAKVTSKMEGTVKNKIGSPDLLILFTGTMSHKMRRCALCKTKEKMLDVARSQSASVKALRQILDAYMMRREAYA